jgi:Xaa-Pro dipeptidase
MSYPSEKVFTGLDQKDLYERITNTGWYQDAVYQTFSQAEYRRRHAAMRDKMAEYNLDCVIAPGNGSNWSYGSGMFWLSGMRLHSGMAQYVVFPREGEATLICSEGGATAEAVRRSVIIQDVRSSNGGDFGNVIADRLEELGLQKAKIGILGCTPGRNDDTMPYNHYQVLKQRLPDAEFEVHRKLLHELWYVKSAEEIAAIEKSGHLLDLAFQAMCQSARPGTSEVEVMAAAAEAVLEAGGEIEFLIIGSTPTADPALPFGNPRPSGRILKKGDVVVNELAVGTMGYTAQMGHPIFIGEPAVKVKSFWDDIALPGFNLLAEYMRPGATARQLQEAGRFYNDHGVQGRPLLLHGIDIITGPPKIGVERIIASDYEKVFKPGMTLMLEPDTITADGLLGLFIGRTFVITETGGYSVCETPVETFIV